MTPSSPSPAPSPSVAGPRATRNLLTYSLGLLVAAVAWASVGELDVVSTAVGEVAPVGRVKAIQHLEGGIVSAILVEEGGRVTRGQPLVRLDPVKASSELEELSARLASLRADMVRLSAEAGGAQTVSFPEDLEQEAPELVQEARGLFETRRRRLTHELAVQETLIAQRQHEIREIETRLLNNRKTLDLVGEQVGISENLLKRDLTNRMMHLDLVRQRQTLQGQIAIDGAARPRVEAALNEARERLDAIRESFREQASRDLAKARQDYDELSQRVLKYRHAQDRLVLRAPVDGIVKTIAVATEGGVIQPGETVAEIVPVEDQLVIEARLPVQDIGYVHPGQDVRVTLDGPDAATFGHLDGVVRTVSPDAMATRDGQSFYKVRVETSETRFESGAHTYQLHPGMKVICSIRIGTRTVMGYLLGPWFRSFRFAFQER